MKVPLRKGFWGGGYFLRTGRRFVKLFYLSANIFVSVCLSVCLSYPVGSNWIDTCQLFRLLSLESRVPNPVVKQRHARQMVPLCILRKVFHVIVCVLR